MSTHTKLSEKFATAICGNDILSSCLYVSGIAIMFAGVYAPIVLFLVAVVLFLYKKVYTEVVEALPINGGAYNCLLNGTAKSFAAVAGVMTFLSYIATAVISAKVGVEYVHTVLPIPVIPATIGLLLIFAVLVISGIKDSAKVAYGIFVGHIGVMFLFLVLGCAYFFTSSVSFFADNATHTHSLIQQHGGWGAMLYLAFSASLLGVSGFESSANFVEEQEKGVFRKTLRNMLVGVTIFNPLIGLAVLNAMPFEAIIGAKDFLLADAARVMGGTVFQYLVVVDAFFVLAGAVLTSYVGVSGLVNRMSSDGCFPFFFSKQNSKGSYPRIVIGFFLLCSSILILTKGNLLSLAGVYTIAFLGVMSSFALGNLILKQTRRRLKRTYQAPVIAVILAFLATFFGVFGNIRINEDNLRFFELYFIPAVIIVLFIIYRDYVFAYLLKITKPIVWLNVKIDRYFTKIVGGRVLAFVHHPGRLYDILRYINYNETSRNIILVYCFDDADPDAQKNADEFASVIPAIQTAGVYPQLSIQFAVRKGVFGPSFVDGVTNEFQVQRNHVFMGAIRHEHEFEYPDLGGVRIII